MLHGIAALSRRLTRIVKAPTGGAKRAKSRGIVDAGGVWDGTDGTLRKVLLGLIKNGTLRKVFLVLIGGSIDHEGTARHSGRQRVDQ